MAGAVKTLAFASRQIEIPGCGIVNLKFSAGDMRAEYLSGSELENDDGSWSYQFLINEADLPGSLTLDDITNGNLIDPFWSCLADDEEAEEEEECEVRTVRCFDGVELIETLTDEDFVAILRHDPECDTYCLGLMNPYDFTEQTQEPLP